MCFQITFLNITFVILLVTAVICFLKMLKTNLSVLQQISLIYTHTRGKVKYQIFMEIIQYNIIFEMRAEFCVCVCVCVYLSRLTQQHVVYGKALSLPDERVLRIVQYCEFAMKVGKCSTKSSGSSPLTARENGIIVRELQNTGLTSREVQCHVPTYGISLNCVGVPCNSQIRDIDIKCHNKIYLKTTEKVQYVEASCYL